MLSEILSHGGGTVSLFRFKAGPAERKPLSASLLHAGRCIRPLSVNPSGEGPEVTLGIEGGWLQFYGSSCSRLVIGVSAIRA